jgi:hypothetical protein
MEVSQARGADFDGQMDISILFVTKAHSAVREEYIHGTQVVQDRKRHFTTPTVKVKGRIVRLDVDFATSASVPFPTITVDPNRIRKQGA